MQILPVRRQGVVPADKASLFPYGSQRDLPPFVSRALQPCACVDFSSFCLEMHAKVLSLPHAGRKTGILGPSIRASPFSRNECRCTATSKAGSVSSFWISLTIAMASTAVGSPSPRHHRSGVYVSKRRLLVEFLRRRRGGQSVVEPRIACDLDDFRQPEQGPAPVDRAAATPQR